MGGIFISRPYGYGTVRRIWPICAFGQSYQQWQNANEICQMRAQLANRAARLLAQMRCAFGQSYRQWPNVCAIRFEGKKDLKRVSAYNYRNKNSTVVNV